MNASLAVLLSTVALGRLPGNTAGPAPPRSPSVRRAAEDRGLAGAPRARGRQRLDDHRLQGTAGHVRRCELVAVHAWSAPLGALAEPLPGPWYALETHRRPPAQVLDDALRGPAKQYPDTTVTRRVVEGAARRALWEAAAGADLLVVGAGRRHARPGLQLGLINHALLHHAPCPVVVVPQR
ncbi:universal stress protein [Streptomyces sp. GD-15H]|uniref:universal stress protein n=1 Tax=Streptomyces sp. GD-15H TaxID=3129112 RepID=UPI003873B463